MEDELVQRFPYVTKEEIDEIRKVAQYPIFRESTFHSILELLDESRKNEKFFGRKALSTGPLTHLISAKLHPNFDRNNQLTMSGRIYLKFNDNGNPVVHDYFRHSYDHPQILDSTSCLPLMTPDYSFPSLHSCMHNSKLMVEVNVGGEIFNREMLCSSGVEEKVSEEFIYGSRGSYLSLRIASIPFALYGRVEILIIRKQAYSFDDMDSHLLAVKGKIVARCCNEYGIFDSDEYTLFDKELERVKIDRSRSMENLSLTRSWVVVPVSSSLLIDLDLSECGTERRLLKEKVEVPVKRRSSCGKKIIVDDEYSIAVYVGWFSPRPQGRRSIDDMELEDESSDDDDEMMSPKGSSKKECDEQIDKCISGMASNSFGRQWFLCPHQTVPSSSSAMEIYSVFVSQKHFKRIYGCIELLSDTFRFFIFKKEANDGLELPHDGKVVSILDGAREFDECSLEIKIDLKDVDGLHMIKGYVEWDERELDFGSFWLDKLMCSVVQSEFGFAAIHYSFFSEAVEATIGFFCTVKKDETYPNFYGSIIARYGSYDYTSEYNKEYFQMVIFQRDEESPAQAQPDFDGLMIPLSRSKVVVPVNSSLVIEANLNSDVSDQVLRDCVEFNIGARNAKMTMEGDCFSVDIYVKWDEVSR